MTKNEMQIDMNEAVEMAYNVFRDEVKTDYIYSKKRLYSCSAYVTETESYIVLTSYSTIVAFIDRYTGVMYDVLRLVYGYTATSAQHISKFARMYERDISVKMTYKPI